MQPFSALRMRSPTGAVITDPSFANVVFLAGWNRAGTSSSNYTEEAKGRTVIFSGSSARTTDSASKFGSASMSIATATTDYAYVADNADFSFGSGAWTIESWVNFTAVATVGGHYFMAQYDTGATQRSWAIQWDQATSALRMLLTPAAGAGGAATIVASASWTPVNNTWYHVVGEFDGTNYRTYVDGVMKGKTSGSLGALHDSTARMSLGSATNVNASNGVFTGSMDETRITKGVARYASDSGYVTPTAAFPRS